MEYSSNEINWLEKAVWLSSFRAGLGVSISQGQQTWAGCWLSFFLHSQIGILEMLYSMRTHADPISFTWLASRLPNFLLQKVEAPFSLRGVFHVRKKSQKKKSEWKLICSEDNRLSLKLTEQWGKHSRNLAYFTGSVQTWSLEKKPLPPLC